MTEWAGLIWLVALLAGNAFFVAAEFAVVTARRAQIEPLAAAGRKGAKTALWAMEHATLMLATTQLGITVCSLLILLVSEPAIHSLLAVPLAATGLGPTAVGAIAFVVTLVLVSFLHVVLGEMVPKNLSFSMPDRAVLLLAPALVGLGRVLRPVIVALNGMANGVVRLFGVTPVSEASSVFTLEEVAVIAQSSTQQGVLHDTTGTLSAAFAFTTKTARHVAVPLDQIVSLADGTTPREVERSAAKNGFSRYLLADGQHLTGYIHLKDVLDLEAGGFDAPIPRYRVRRLVPVRADTDLEDALAALRRMGTHLARVYDRHDETVGVLFLEDIIEELVGHIEDATARSRP